MNVPQARLKRIFISVRRNMDVEVEEEEEEEEEENNLVFLPVVWAPCRDFFAAA